MPFQKVDLYNQPAAEVLSVHTLMQVMGGLVRIIIIMVMAKARNSSKFSEKMPPR